MYCLDYTPRIVVKAGFADLDRVPSNKRGNVFRQLLRLRDFRTPYEGRYNQLLLIECFANLRPDKVARVVESALPFFIFSADPIFADDRNKNAALGEPLFNDLRKFCPGGNGIQITEYLFFTKVMS